MNTAVIGFTVVEEFTIPTTKTVGYRHLSRRYHVKDAAEQFAELARKSGHPKCYVQETVGQADPLAPKGKRR